MRNNLDVSDSILFVPRYLSNFPYRELQSLPADSNDIHVRILAEVDIAVLFFLGGQTYCMAGHSADILFTL
jgi:hypothetical protein